MIPFSKELVNRFIEFGLMVTKGKGSQEQMTSALRSCTYLIAVLILAASAMGILYLDQHVRNNDVQVGLARVANNFDPEGTLVILNTIGRANETLVTQNAAMHQKNILLLSTMVTLTERNKAMTAQLIHLLDEYNNLKKNNETLRQMCMGKVKD